jgi:hypothetical protein
MPSKPTDKNSSTNNLLSYFYVHFAQLSTFLKRADATSAVYHLGYHQVPRTMYQVPFILFFALLADFVDTFSYWILAKAKAHFVTYIH